MKKLILFRKDRYTEQELLEAKKYFSVIESRMEVLDNSLVVGRYSVLPFYKELERDLSFKNSKLINSYSEHSYIADMGYILDIEEFTPKTYYSLNEISLEENKSYIIKGRTNSLKFQWKDKMFAPNRTKAIEIYLDLMNDQLLGNQGLVLRDYIPLKKISMSINGMPFSNEWRFFFYQDKILTYNYYWSSSDIIPKKESLPKKAIDFAKKVAKVMAEKTNFFVLDIAETEKGEWIVIEANDGQMSGLSENNPKDLYQSLHKILG